MKKSLVGTAFAAALVSLATAGWSLAEQAQDYLKLDRSSKVNHLWKEVEKSAYSRDALPEGGPNGWSLVAGAMPWFLHKTFTHDSDVMPLGREKVVHPIGTVARVRWVVDNPSLATGMFSESTVGLARLSVAAGTDPFVPGIALKLPVDAEPSINFVAVYTLDGQEERNFFANPFSTSIPKPKSVALKAGQLAFRLALRTLRNAPESELRMPNTEAASIRPDGSRVEEIRAPWEVVFYPTEEAASLARPMEGEDFRGALAGVPSGSTLYRIYLRLTSNGALERVGRLVTESRFVASEFGDERLFFQHQRRLRR